jgi:hypothetical protein
MGNERDDKGRFLPGHEPKSPGRPRTDAAEKLRASLESVVSNGTLPKWQESMKKRLARGDQWATEFVFERIAGKVVSSVEVSGTDGGPIELRVVYDAKLPDTSTDATS